MNAKSGTLHGMAGKLPLDRLGHECRGLAGAVGTRMLGSLTGKVVSMTGRLTEYADTGGKAGGGSSGAGLLGSAGKAVKGVFGGKGKGKGKAEGGKTRVTNVIETLDIGAPLSVVYNQWTAFEDYPSFTKKVESVTQESAEELTWKAQVLWSHRTWKSEIIEQVPDERIIWRSQGDKGYVDGAVTFHELTPNLTRVILVLEYHPKGLVEHIGNMWRAQGRRARLEFKHFGRHVMTQAMLHPDEVEGWRGEIHDGEAVEREPDEQEPEDASGGEPEQPGDREADTSDQAAGEPDESGEPGGDDSDQPGGEEPDQPGGGEDGPDGDEAESEAKRLQSQPH